MRRKRLLEAEAATDFLAGFGPADITGRYRTWRIPAVLIG